jgi:hypothetical protein
MLFIKFIFKSFKKRFVNDAFLETSTGMPLMKNRKNDSFLLNRTLPQKYFHENNSVPGRSPTTVFPGS